MSLSRSRCLRLLHPHVALLVSYESYHYGLEPHVPFADVQLEDIAVMNLASVL
jgi:hypothetical protein